jgi:DNA-binding transcriptional LysR family regulator
VDIRHYRSFIALAEEGSFTSAARKLHLVQSGLSVTIKEMEDEVGVKLVQRTTRRVSLTDAGVLFLEYVRPAVTMLNDGVEAVRSQSGVLRGRIRLGILMSLGPYIDLPTVLGGFHAKYPNVDFAVRSVDNPQAPELVRSGSIDLCFHALSTRKLAAGVEATPFARDFLVAACANTHPLAQRKSVTLEALTQFPFVDLSPERTLRTLVDRSFAEHHLSRKSMFEVSAVDTMLRFVAAGLGVSIVPSALAKAWVAVPKLHILPFRAQRFHMPKWTLVILTRSQRQKFAGKTVQDLMLETLMEAKSIQTKAVSSDCHP